MLCVLHATQVLCSKAAAAVPDVLTPGGKACGGPGQGGLAECSLNASSRPRDTSELSSAWVSLTSLSKVLALAARNTNFDAN